MKARAVPRVCQRRVIMDICKVTPQSSEWEAVKNFQIEEFLSVREIILSPEPFCPSSV